MIFPNSPLNEANCWCLVLLLFNFAIRRKLGYWFNSSTCLDRVSKLYVHTKVAPRFCNARKNHEECQSTQRGPQSYVPDRGPYSKRYMYMYVYSYKQTYIIWYTAGMQIGCIKRIQRARGDTEIGETVSTQPPLPPRGIPGFVPRSRPSLVHWWLPPPPAVAGRRRNPPPQRTSILYKSHCTNLRYWMRFRICWDKWKLMLCVSTNKNVAYVAFLFPDFPKWYQREKAFKGRRRLTKRALD